MHDAPIDQYFELALDLPEKMRRELLARLDREDPAMGRELRATLDRWLQNKDFACEVGQGGQSNNTAPPSLDVLHHVAVQVDDIEQAAKWYRDRFRCELEYLDATWAMLRFANMRIALVLPGQHPPHVAVALPDAAAFGEVREHRDGTRFVYTEDPWGNTVEVLEAGSFAPERRP